jgi:hypothetical protein
LLPAVAGDGVQLDVKVGPVVTFEQVMSVHPLPLLAVCGVHDAVSVGPVLLVPQVTVV